MRRDIAFVSPFSIYRKDCAMTDNILVRPVTCRKELKSFINFPWVIYHRDRNWVPPLISDQKTLLDPEKNPFFQHSEVQHYLAYRGSEIVGRISALVNHNYNEFQGEKTGFFGFYESVNDVNVAQALFAAAENWLRDKKMERMRGPMNPSTNDTCGLLIDAFNRPPVLMMTYNPPYYVELFKKVGLEKVRDLFAYYMDTSVPISEKVKRVADAIRKRHNITIRSVNVKNFFEELQRVKEVYNDAWSRNWGFVPMTDAEFDHLAKELKPLLVPELAIFALIEDEPVGFSLSLPDFNKALIKINGRLFPFGFAKLLWYSRKIDMLRVVIMGVKKKYQKLGIDAVFYYETYVRGVQQGYTRGEFSWILDNNYPMRHSLENMGATIYKTYRVYDKVF